MENEKRLIGDLYLTKAEVNEAFSYFYNQYGKSITLWDNARKTVEINTYWKNKKHE